VDHRDWDASQYIQRRYAPGGLISSSGGNGGDQAACLFAVHGTGYSWYSRPADPGLDAAGAAETPVVPGWVSGYRWWHLPAPDWIRSPARAEEHWPHAALHGVRGPWEAGPGPWLAKCLLWDCSYGAHDRRAVPAAGCRCGHWATWNYEDRTIHDDRSVPVLGVIKGFGRTRLGTRGFRCEKARILGLHPDFTLQPYVAARCLPGYKAPQYVTRVMDDGRELLLPASVTYAEAQAALSHADAWMAVIGDRLEQDYPGVRVSETRDDLVAAFPPDPVYSHRTRACWHCGDPAPGYGHELSCQGRYRYFPRGTY